MDRHSIEATSVCIVQGNRQSSVIAEVNIRNDNEEENVSGLRTSGLISYTNAAMEEFVNVLSNQKV